MWGEAVNITDSQSGNTGEWGTTHQIAFQASYNNMWIRHNTNTEGWSYFDRITHEGISSQRYFNSNMTKGTAPSAAQYSNLFFCDRTRDPNHAGGRLAGIEQSLTTANVNRINLRCYKPEANSSSVADVYVQVTADGTMTSGSTVKFYGAVWNDYAEFRQTKEVIEPGRCVKEIGDDTLELTTKRLERGCEIVSDTFGFAIGQTDEAQTPIAASGRVLAYGYEDREEFRKHIGWPVCSGPNGTVSIMTEEEEEKYPSRIIGTISAVPDYEEWGSESVKVNNRIWIQIR